MNKQLTKNSGIFLTSVICVNIVNGWLVIPWGIITIVSFIATLYEN